MELRIFGWMLACGALPVLSGCGLVAAAGATRVAEVVIVATATAHEPQPALTGPALGVLRDAADGAGRASAVVIGPDGVAARFGLTPMRGEQVEHGPRRGALIGANLDRVGAALDVLHAPAGGLPLLDLMNAARRGVVAPATLLVLSSGLSTGGAFDLRQVGWDADPARLARDLAARGFLPDLRGWTVRFVGLGEVAGAQPRLPEPQRRALNAYWLRICAVTGAAACRLDERGSPPRPARSTAPVPVVPVPAVTSERGPQGSVLASVPAALLFTLDSAALLPGADDALGPLVRQALAGGDLVRITGHADASTGTPAHNRDLSTARARAVADRLIALGLPRGRLLAVTGVGSAGEPPGAELTAGRPDPVKAAAQRKVVIELIPAG